MRRLTRCVFKILRFKLVLIGLLFPLCVFATPELNSTSINLRNLLLASGYVEIPLSVPTDKSALLTNIIISGRQYAMIVDTGAAFTTLEKRYANQLNAKLTGQSNTIGGVGGLHSKAYKAIIPKFSLAGFSSHNETLYLSQHSYSYIKMGKYSVIGLLGLDYLMRHQAIIDVVGQKLYVKPVDIFYDEAFSFSQPSIPLEYTPTGHVTVMASINNANPQHFLFDTGVPVLMIAADYAKTLNLKYSAPAMVGKGSGGGDMAIFPTQINQLTIDKTHYVPKQVLITNLQNARVGLPIAGVVGLDWMQANHAIIDMQHDVVYINKK